MNSQHREYKKAIGFGTSMKHITCIEDLRQRHMRKVPKAFFDYCDRWMYEEDTQFRQIIGKCYVDQKPGNPETIKVGQHLLSTADKDFGSEGHVWDKLAAEMWSKYRTMPGMPPTDGWKKPHDDSYYRNAIGTADKK